MRDHVRREERGDVFPHRQVGRRDLSAAGLRRVFETRSTQIPSHPSRRRGDHALNPDMRPEGPLTPAAVLVPVVERDGGLTLLLTQRTKHLANHAGQISFPGGRIEDDDDGPIDAALRETEEEIGLDRSHIQVIGTLDDYVTRTGFRVRPVVGLIAPPFRLKADPFEVADIFEVPLDYLLNPANHEIHQRVIKGISRSYHAMPYKQYYIWGATAGMLMNFYEVVCLP